ncbi:MAG TPA: hypothetical protein VF084_12040, partial [Nitrososphaeraceae archaeon]
MKIILTTMLVALLAIGLIGINYGTTGNAYAQTESEDSSMMQDDTGMRGMDADDEVMMMTTMSNQSKEM